MGIGLYVHIPFCLQQCSYCDFTTRLDDSSLHQPYVENLVKEIITRSKFVPNKQVDSLYFGGGTPSLLNPAQLDSIIQTFKKEGFLFSQDAECTIEINPGTISPQQLDQYQKIGINRFSLGAQTFNDKMLKKIGRLHSKSDTIESIELLNSNKLNYSFDLLFALPEQSSSELINDLDKIAEYLPPHISSYYLTIPESHKLQKNRAPEEEQLVMFDLLEETLKKLGYEQYEISNFARNKSYAKHNLSAWLGGYYWGIGVSAHSHLNLGGDDFRFWNPNTNSAWEKALKEQQIGNWQSPSLFEKLNLLDQTNDKVHTSLRLSRGLNIDAIDESLRKDLKDKIEQAKMADFLSLQNNHWVLTKKGRRLLNYVLEELFLS